MGEICVVVDNHRLQPLLPDSDGASGSLRLTTIRSTQSRALFEIKSRIGDRTATLYSFEADGLPADRPRMEVRGRIDARTLSLEFLLRERVFHRAAVTLPATRPSAMWVLIPIVLVAAAVGLLLVPRPGAPVSETIAQSPPAPPPEPSLEPASASLPAERSEVAVPSTLRLSVYFLPDDAALLPETRNLLDRLLASLGDAGGWRIEITGHCAIAGTEKGRIDLSLKRAHEVSVYLKAGGLSPETEPAVTGVGAARPVTLDPGLQHLNRRTEISAAKNDSG